jgi:hypothetical protein
MQAGPLAFDSLDRVIFHRALIDDHELTAPFSLRNLCVPPVLYKSLSCIKEHSRILIILLLTLILQQTEQLVWRWWLVRLQLVLLS